ncbi:hypothetical protein KEF29_13935 [Streptomyces tuirus]|uniref:Condensation domain-containing protein n=1 Tax=Streptomyces tuirus TaxID=68278 RepID=A0A941FAV3_9ACTN|nr:hypothetical protein [Streptomyces tuirus]
MSQHQLPAQHRGGPAAPPDDVTRASAETLPLTAGQREVWLAEQHSPGLHTALRLGEYLEIHGPVDPALFETALRRVVAETDALRVRLVPGDDGPVQILEAELPWTLPFVDVSDAPDADAAARAWISADLARPMDLASGPLFSYALFRLEPDRYWWYHTYHHAAVDAFGYALVARRVAEVYTALAQGRSPAPAPSARCRNWSGPTRTTATARTASRTGSTGCASCPDGRGPPPEPLEPPPGPYPGHRPEPPGPRPARKRRVGNPAYPRNGNRPEPRPSSTSPEPTCCPSRTRGN